MLGWVVFSRTSSSWSISFWRIAWSLTKLFFISLIATLIFAFRCWASLTYPKLPWPSTFPTLYLLFISSTFLNPLKSLKLRILLYLAVLVNFSEIYPELSCWSGGISGYKGSVGWSLKSSSSVFRLLCLCSFYFIEVPSWERSILCSLSFWSSGARTMTSVSFSLFK